MADVTSSSDDSGDMVQMFKCKQCADGTLYTPAERDLHRQWHRQNPTQSPIRQALKESSEVTSIFEQARVPSPRRSRKIRTRKPKFDEKHEVMMRKIILRKENLAGGGYMAAKKRDRIPLSKKQRKIRSNKAFDKSQMISSSSSSTTISGG